MLAQRHSKSERVVKNIHRGRSTRKKGKDPEVGTSSKYLWNSKEVSVVAGDEQRGKGTIRTLRKTASSYTG